MGCLEVRVAPVEVRFQKIPLMVSCWALACTLQTSFLVLRPRNRVFCYGACVFEHRFMLLSGMFVAQQICPSGLPYVGFYLLPPCAAPPPSLLSRGPGSYPTK